MAAVKEKYKKHKTKGAGAGPDWTKTGSFIHKPDRGWIHPDEQLLPDAGVCYGVRYIGCLEVKESMRNLDFETRTALAREAINKVTEAAGLKTTNRKRKIEKKISKMLGDLPKMQHAGSNVNLTITTDSLSLMVMESGEIIANHEMPGISFASGGDAETLDFVSYVAKDPINHRACHVFECGGGLAEDVITTIGQAFELRFKEFLKQQPRALTVPDRIENPLFDNETSAWGDEPEYYNDRPGARPPSPRSQPPPVPPLPQYSAPKSNLPVRDGNYASDKEAPGIFMHERDTVAPLIDLSDPAEGTTAYDNPEAGAAAAPITNPLLFNGNSSLLFDSKLSSHPQLDAFDMEPFTASLPADGESSSSSSERSPKELPERVPEKKLRIDIGKKSAVPSLSDEEWFHGAIARKMAEDLLKKDGDFLVRESTNSRGQFVLSGRQNGSARHLLLVDPEGVVRTKDRVFESVSHLIDYHRSNSLPIVSHDNELYLLQPIKTAKT
ncbi:SHC-transforming protein 1-like isoform X2 [Liolophura sinensis]